MALLALDTALGATNIAVVDLMQDTILAARSQRMERGHAEALIPMIEAVMAEVEGGFTAIDRIAVTVGPGSFTGLRVAIAAAKAMGLALEIPVVGVSTLAAYAAPLITAGQDRTIAAAIDARHGAVFFQSFWMDGRKAFGPAVVSIETALKEMHGGAAIVSGTGAGLLKEVAERAGLDITIADDGPAPDIVWVARLAAAADPAFAPARPLYLRDASATPQAGARIPRA